MILGPASKHPTEYTEGDVDATITGPAILWEDTGDVLRPVSVAKPLPVDIISSSGSDSVEVTKSIGTVSTVNSSTALLGNGGIFTGTSEEVKDFSTIEVNVFSDKASATDGLSFEWSSNGTDWDLVETVSVAANTGRAFRLSPRARYFRLVYTNGVTTQTAFRLQTIFHPHQLAPISRSLDKDVPEFSSAQTVRSVLAAQRAGGSNDYVNIQATNGGNLKVAVEEFDTSLPTGTNSIGTVKLAEDVETTGNLTATGQTVDVTILEGRSTAGIQIAGTWGGVVEFYYSVDGTNFHTMKVNDGTKSITDSTINGVFFAGVGGVKVVRVRGGIINFGACNVTVRQSVGMSLARPLTSVQVNGPVDESEGYAGFPVIVGGLNTTDGGAYALTLDSSLRLNTVVGSVVPGSASTNLGKREDDPHTSLHTGVMALAVRDDTPVAGANASANKDYVPLITDNFGRLWVAAVGDVANGGADSGNPVKVGGVGLTTLPTAVATTQRVSSMFDVFGRQVVIPQAPRELTTDEVLTITSTTAAQSFALSTASTFYDITSLTVTNISAVGTEVQLLNNDGTTVRESFYVPPNETRGIAYPVPLKAAGAGVVWKAKTVTSVASVKIGARYVLNK
jgi:hypothetical protein